MSPEYLLSNISIFLVVKRVNNNIIALTFVPNYFVWKYADTFLSTEKPQYSLRFYSYFRGQNNAKKTTSNISKS